MMHSAKPKKKIFPRRFVLFVAGPLPGEEMGKGLERSKVLQQPMQREQVRCLRLKASLLLFCIILVPSSTAFASFIFSLLNCPLMYSLKNEPGEPSHSIYS